MGILLLPHVMGVVLGEVAGAVLKDTSPHVMGVILGT